MTTSMPSWRKAAASPSKSARQADLLVIVLVHEDQHVAVVEQELEVLGVEADALDRLGASGSGRWSCGRR